MKFFLIFLFSLSLQAETRWITDDFFVSVAPHDSEGVREIPKDCRAHIKKAVCLVSSNPNEMDCNDRKCLPGSENYAIHFERLYDAYPEALKKMFCHLDNIFIENNFFGTAYAGSASDPSGKITRVCIGIRKSVIDANLNLEQWASWKEQLSFGGEKESYSLTPGLPYIQSKTEKPVNDFLYFVIAHEFGHQFDFANQLNEYKDPKCIENEKAECELVPGSYGSLSWLTDKTVKPEFEFPHRKDLCFYDCKGKKIPSAGQGPLYEALHTRTPFLSTYSVTEPWDDFADSVAYIVAHKQLKSNYDLYADGKQYSTMAKISAPIFKPKYDYITRFLARKDIKYPKD